MPKFSQPIDKANRWDAGPTGRCVVRAFKGGFLGRGEDSALYLVVGKWKPSAIYRYFVNTIPPPLSTSDNMISVELSPREWNRLAKKAKDLRKPRKNPYRKPAKLPVRKPKKDLTLDDLLDHIEDLLGAGLDERAGDVLEAAEKLRPAMTNKQRARLNYLSLDYTRRTSMGAFAMNKSSKPSVKKRRAAIAVADKGVPAKRRNESWLAYHDRLSALAAELMAAGVHGSKVNRILAVAGEIARVHKSVRTRKRKGQSKGPGSYPWEECVRQAMKQYAGYADVEDRARRVCGAIRARSQRKYPAYWRARQPGRKIPGPKPGSRWNPDFFGSATDRKLVEEYQTMLNTAKKAAKGETEKIWLNDQLAWTRAQLRHMGARKNPGKKAKKKTKKSVSRADMKEAAERKSRELERLKRQIGRL